MNFWSTYLDRYIDLECLWLWAKTPHWKRIMEIFPEIFRTRSTPKYFGEIYGQRPCRNISKYFGALQIFRSLPEACSNAKVANSAHAANYKARLKHAQQACAGVRNWRAPPGHAPHKPPAPPTPPAPWQIKQHHQGRAHPSIEIDQSKSGAAPRAQARTAANNAKCAG